MALTKPTQITVPFASSGLKNTIQETATGSNRASMQEGFPPITMQDVDQGGMAPYGEDMNGIIYDVTKAIQYQQAGGFFPYDATFAAAIDGYPIGAIVTSADGTQLFQNTLDGNQSDPENGGANWSNIMTSASLAGKQDKLNQTQMDAVNSGITSAKVAIYDSYASTKQNTLTFDNTPTNGSSNPVTSDGIYAALGTKQDTITVDAVPTDGSTNPVQSGGVYDAVQTLETAVNGKVSKSGDTMTGELNVVANYGVNDSTGSHIASTSFCTTRRSCIVGNSGTSLSSPWYKVGTYISTNGSTPSSNCLMYVACTDATRQQGGLLNVHMRLLQNHGFDTDNTKLEWVTTYGNLNPNDFVLVCNNDSNSVTFDLYVRCNVAYIRYVFKVIGEKENSQNTSIPQSVVFNLANNVSNGSLASLPAGTQIVSTIEKQKDRTYSKRMTFKAPSAFADKSAAMSALSTVSGQTITELYPQAVAFCDGMLYVMYWGYYGSSPVVSYSGHTILAVFNYSTQQYVRYHVLTGTRNAESLVVKKEGSNTFVYAESTTSKIFRFQLDTTNGSTLAKVNDGNESIDADVFISYRKGTWCVLNTANQVSGRKPAGFSLYDDSWNYKGQLAWTLYDFDDLSDYEALDAHQMAMPHVQGVELGDDGLYLFKGGNSKYDASFPNVSAIGVQKMDLYGNISKSSLCDSVQFRSAVSTIAGGTVSISESEGGFITDDGSVYSLYLLRVGGTDYLTVFEEFSDWPVATDFSACAFRQSNIPFLCNTPQLPRGKGGYFYNPFTNELITCLDDVFVMMYNFGIDNISLSAYGINGQDWTVLTKHKTSDGQWVTDGTYPVCSDNHYIAVIRRMIGNIFIADIKTFHSGSVDASTKQIQVSVANGTVAEVYRSTYEASFLIGNRVCLGTDYTNIKNLWNANGTLQWDSKDVITAGGGTLSGTLKFSYSEAIRSATKDSQIAITGCPTGYLDGARLTLNGVNRSTGGGVFNLTSADGTNQYALRGGADGTLTWNGQTIQTSSDARLKTEISDVPDEVLDAWGDVNWGQFQFLSAIEKKGDSARQHLGLIAQRVKETFEAKGLDACDYGILCHDIWEDDFAEETVIDSPAVLDEEGNVIKEEVSHIVRTKIQDAGELWMIRYEEALAMEAAYQRRRADRIEARLQALEERLNDAGTW